MTCTYVYAHFLFHLHSRSCARSRFSQYYLRATARGALGLLVKAVTYVALIDFTRARTYCPWTIGHLVRAPDVHGIAIRFDCCRCACAVRLKSHAAFYDSEKWT